MVGRLTPKSAAICATVCLRLPSLPVSSYICRASLIWRGPSLGFAAGAAARAGRGESVHGSF